MVRLNYFQPPTGYSRLMIWNRVAKIMGGRAGSHLQRNDGRRRIRLVPRQGTYMSLKWVQFSLLGQYVENAGSQSQACSGIITMVSLMDVVEALPLIKESESSEVVRVAPELADVCAYLDPLSL
jgi:hypothetical protein